MKYYLKSRNTFISILSNLANIGKNLWYSVVGFSVFGVKNGRILIGQ